MDMNEKKYVLPLKTCVDHILSDSSNLNLMQIIPLKEVISPLIVLFPICQSGQWRNVLQNKQFACLESVEDCCALGAGFSEAGLLHVVPGESLVWFSRSVNDRSSKS